jgi:hypothetical protein
MSDLSPVETLTAAAKLLRGRAAAIGAPEAVRDTPWHVEECVNAESGDCPCIVAQGRFDSGEGPVEARLYVADAETPAHATWIALMHPGVGLALADWLELEASLLEALPVDDAEALNTVPARLVLQSCRHALTVARALLGGAS